MCRVFFGKGVGVKKEHMAVIVVLLLLWWWWSRRQAGPVDDVTVDYSFPGFPGAGGDTRSGDGDTLSWVADNQSGGIQTVI